MVKATPRCSAAAVKLGLNVIGIETERAEQLMACITTVRLTSSVFDAMIAYSMVYDIR